MKMIKLLDAAYVGGVLHYPHDGVLEVTDAEAKRLTGENLAVDVTDDFTPDNKPARKKAAEPKE